MKSQCVLFYLPMESPLNGREYFPMNSPIFSWWFSETIIKSSKFQILLINSIRIGFVGKILTGNHRFPHYSYGAFRFKFSLEPIHWSMSTLFSSQNQLLPAPWLPTETTATEDGSAVRRGEPPAASWDGRIWWDEPWDEATKPGFLVLSIAF